jgi:hypothetical protein
VDGIKTLLWLQVILDRIGNDSYGKIIQGALEKAGV